MVILSRLDRWMGDVVQFLDLLHESRSRDRDLMIEPQWLQILWWSGNFATRHPEKRC
ncbi:hypothetical protein [Lusitaniella coriacea]|uniref:hypothetical protein n=1 Tax=Lusitaniella coriacea TaxID=1983105 RepID=UPI003CFA88D8